MIQIFHILYCLLYQSTSPLFYFVICFPPGLVELNICPVTSSMVNCGYISAYISIHLTHDQIIKVRLWSSDCNIISIFLIDIILGGIIDELHLPRPHANFHLGIYFGMTLKCITGPLNNKGSYWRMMTHLFTNVSEFICNKLIGFS